MAERKVIIEVKVKLVANMSEDEEVSSLIENMDYNFKASPDTNADIEDTEILDYEVIDSK
jgi:hypothetical protein